MTNSAQTALQKMIEALGEPPKTLTRIQIFSKVARLANDIEQKRLYPDMIDEHREGVLRDLKRYFLMYRAEQHLLNHPLFYARAWFYRATRPPEAPKPPAMRQNIDGFIRQSSKAKDFTKIFDDCLDEIAENRDAYPLQTVNDVLGDLSSASHIGVPLLRTIFRHMTGYTRNETQFLLDRLSRFSHEYDREQVDQAIAARYNPTIGPDSVEELYFMQLMLYNHALHPAIPSTQVSRDMMKSFERLLDLSRSLCRDLPTQNLNDQLRVFTSSPLTDLARAQIMPDTAVPDVLAMSRYFFERHGDKLDAQSKIALSQAMADLYIHNFFQVQEMRTRFGGEQLSDEHQAVLIQKMLLSTWAEWEKPSVDDMIASIDARLKTKNKIKFHTLLDQAEPYFDFHVSFYSEQNEAMWKLRRNLFKNGSIGSEGEGHRAMFMKDLADNHTPQLIAAGLSKQDITFMSRTGKLPPNSAAASQWNVDHVVDIHAGGTNNPDNLCFMSASLNQLKNTFLLLQTSPSETANKGYWVLTLRPKRDSNGEPRHILAEAPSTPKPALTPNGPA